MNRYEMLRNLLVGIGALAAAMDAAVGEDDSKLEDLLAEGARLNANLDECARSPEDWQKWKNDFTSWIDALAAEWQRRTSNESVK